MSLFRTHRQRFLQNPHCDSLFHPPYMTWTGRDLLLASVQETSQHFLEAKMKVVGSRVYLTNFFVLFFFSSQILVEQKKKIPNTL